MRTGLLAIFVALLFTGCTTPTVIPTPIPTAIPTPAPIVAAAPTKDDALLRYKLKVTPLMNDYTSATNQAMAAMPANALTDVANQARLKAALGTYSGALTDISIALGSMDVPRVARPFHSCFTEFISMKVDSTFRLQTALTVNDTTLMSEGQQILVAAGTRWTECASIFKSQLQ